MTETFHRSAKTKQLQRYLAQEIGLHECPGKRNFYETSRAYHKRRVCLACIRCWPRDLLMISTNEVHRPSLAGKLNEASFPRRDWYHCMERCENSDALMFLCICAHTNLFISSLWLSSHSSWGSFLT